VANLAVLVQTNQMRVLPTNGLVAGTLLVLLVLGCQAAVDSDKPGSGPGSGASSGGSSTAGTTGNVGGAQNLAGGVAVPPDFDPTALLPARIRRLTVAEYQATVSDPRVIGADARDVSLGFVPDSRQDPHRGAFTVNEAQRVDPVFARQLSEAAIKLAASLRQHVLERAKCTNPATDHDTCAESFIRSFGEQAYRRPLDAEEVTSLMTVFHAAFEGGSYDEGIELVVRAMLQSASFLYLTEIGDGLATTVKLTPYELASQISYLVQGGPPSDELLKGAKNGELETSEGRAALAESAHLFEGQDTGMRVSRVVREWLGTDRVAEIAKDTNVYAAFAEAQPAIAQETSQFLNSLVPVNGGSLQQLLAGNWTMANAKLAKFYNVTGVNGDAFVRVDTPNRLGILNQAAFMSVFAHASETAPVLRGVAVMRRVACAEIGDPVGLSRAIVPPVPDTSKTVRERFTVHSADPQCAVCHERIDNFGFAFERFDGMGHYYDDGKDTNRLAVDSSVVVSGTDFDGSYADSNALVTAMSTSMQVRQCFARHIFRAMAGTNDPAFSKSEDDFVKYWDTTLARANNQVTDVSIIGTISAFITSPSFNYRRGR
jgi:uncharacterized protein DUF1592/uncharacterized protein DUF1588/uncharacterized protein DUF1595